MFSCVRTRLVSSARVLSASSLPRLAIRTAMTSASTPSRATESQISSLASFSTCEISDALVKLKVPNGGFVPDLDMLSTGTGEDGRVAGEAYTVKMVEGTDVEAPTLSGHIVDLAPSGSIMVISSPPHVKSASLGGLLALSAAVRGVKGVVIDGRCRDLTEIRALNLPLFARGHSTLGQSPFTRPSQVQIPITIRPLNAPSFPPATINPFDIVVADVDGVVVVPPSLVDQVLALAKAGKAIDAKCREDLEAGRGVKETFAEHRGK